MGIAFAPGNSLIPEVAGAVPPDREDPLRTHVARDVTPWLLAGICGITLAPALWLTRGVNPLNLDTPSYLYFDPSRTIGYPAFLWLVKLLTGHAAAAVPAQMMVLAAALFVLGRSFHDLVGRPRLSLIFQLLLVCSPDLWRSSAQLMTEALATASVTLWCALLLRQIRRPSAGGHLLLASVAAAGALIRPSLLVLFAGTAIAALLFENAQGRRLAWMSIIPAAIVALLVTPAAYLFIHGSAVTTSPLARGVLQHTLFCNQTPDRSDPDALFVDQNSSAVRRYVLSAPKDVQSGLEHLYSAPLRFESIIPALGRLHHLNAGWQTDPIVSRIAKRRVESDPICYAESVLSSYWGLVTQGSVHIGGQGRRVDEFLAAHPPVPIRSEPQLPADEKSLQQAASELRVSAPVPHAAIGHFRAKASPLLLLTGRLLYGAAALIGLLSLSVVISGRRIGTDNGRYIVGLAAMGFVLHALFAGTAISELALIRYTIPAWPIVCTLLALILTALRLRDQSSAISSMLGTARSHHNPPNATTAAVSRNAPA